MEGTSGEGAHPPAPHTVTVALFDFPRHPVHGLSTHLSGEIPVKGGRASTLRGESEKVEGGKLTKPRDLSLQKERLLD